MNRKLKYVLLGVLMLGAASTFTSCSDYDDDIETLQEQIDSLTSLHSSEISTVESTLSSLQSTASSLSTSISSVKSELSSAVDALEEADEALEAAVAANSSDISDLQSTVATNSSDISALQTTVTTLQSTVDNLTSELASLTAAYEQVAAAIETLGAAVATNASGVATNAAAIASLEEALVEANAAIKVAQAAADAAATAAAQAQTDVDALTIVVASLSSDLSSLTDTVTTLASDLAALPDQISDIEEAVEDLTAAQTKIETALSSLESDVKDALAQVADAQADATSALTQIAVLDSCLNALSGVVEANAADIATNAGNIEANASAIAALQDYAGTLEERIAELESYKEETSTTIADLEERLAVAEELLNTIYGTADDGGTLTELQASINSVEAKMQEQIDELITGLTELAAQVATIQTNIQEMYSLLSAQLKSLVFIPEAYVDAVPTVIFSEFVYVAQTGTELDTDDESYGAAVDSEGNTVAETVISKSATAKYIVNPSNASIDITKLSIYDTYTQNATYTSSGTRTAASTDYALGIDYDATTYSGPSTSGTSTLEVALTVTGTAATDSHISTFALQYTYPESDEEDADELTVTSDFAAVYQELIDEIYIGQVYDKDKKYDIHYRTEAYELDEAAQIAYNEYTANKSTYGPRYYTEKALFYLDADYELLYTESLDLNTIVAVHHACADGSYKETIDPSDYGLTLEYELVKGYLAGETETPQHEFLQLEGSVITPISLNGKLNGTATIGRAPIIRILLKDGSNVVKVAYIKVYIVDEKIAESTTTFSATLTTPDFDCSEGAVTSTDITFTDEILDALGVSKSYFFSNFSLANPHEDIEDAAARKEPVTDEKGNVTDYEYVSDKDSYVVVYGWDAYTTTTPVFQWNFSFDYLYEHSGETVEYPVTFTYGATSVTVTLTVTLPTVAKTLDLVTTSQVWTTYWYDNLSYTLFNPSVPGAFTGEKDVFVNYLTTPFSLTNGSFVLDGEAVDIDFYFCKDMADTLTIGGYDVIFTLDDDATELYGILLSDAKEKKLTADDLLSSSELIATIDNENEDYTDPQVIIYNDGTGEDNSNTLAELLLNSGSQEMYVLISMKGSYVCSNECKLTAVTFNGEDHFVAKYYRPINVAAESEAVFADGVANTHAGASIEITDLLSLSDWNDKTPDSFYSGYTFYYHYGIGTCKVETDEEDGSETVTWTLNITVETDDIQYVDMSGKTGDLATTQSVTYEDGVLTYLNSGNTVAEDNYFYLLVPVSIEYDWGTITQDVKVKVISALAYEKK